MPIIAIEPGWGAIWCCDGAGTGGVCDPWCANAAPEVQERYVGSQHLGYVDFSSVPAQRCDDVKCWCNAEEGDDA